MVGARIYLEGGGDSKDGKVRCREGFRKLLKKCGISRRMPRLIASGHRESAYRDFGAAHADASGSEYVALLIDSEAPVSDIDRAWDHLRQRDGWQRPPDAHDDQVFLMTTCMETWIVADRNALGEHFGQYLQDSALPPLNNLEDRPRGVVQNSLRRATNNSTGPYTKGPKSFELLGKLDPDTLESCLPSFGRARWILDTKLSQG